MAVAPPQLDLQALAANAANTKYNAQLAAMERQRQLTELADQTNVDSINNFQPTGTAVIQNTFGDLVKNLVANRSIMGQEFDQSANAIQGAYDRSAQYSQANEQDSLDWLKSLGANIGVGGQSPNDQGAVAQLLLSQTDPMQNRMAGYGANAVANARQWGTEHLAHMQNDIGLAQERGAGEVSGFQKQIADLLSQAGLARSQHQFDILGGISDLQGEKGSYTVDALNDLVAREYQQQRDYAGDQLNEAQLAAQIQMHNAAMQESAADRAMKAQLSGQDLERQASQDAWEREKFLLSLGIDSGRLSLDQKKEAFDEMQSGGNKSYSGESGLAQWAQATGASPDIIAVARNYADQGYLAQDANHPDPYSNAVGALNNANLGTAHLSGKPWHPLAYSPGPNKDMVRQALAILAGQYGGAK